MSNIYALLLARHRKFPKIKEEGMYSGQKLVVYTSSQVTCLNKVIILIRSEFLFTNLCSLMFFLIQSHFSIKKAAIMLGIGLNNVCSIPCDERFVTFGETKIAKIET